MDEQARKALEAAMKLPVSRGGFKEEFITEADLRGEEEPTPDGRCDLCGSVIKHGEGYAFFCSAIIEPLNVPVGNMMLCQKCTEDTITERAWAAKSTPPQPNKPKTSDEFARMFAGMQTLNAYGIVANCKRLGLSPEAAKRKARELAIRWWQDREIGQKETRLFWTSEPKSVLVSAGAGGRVARMKNLFQADAVDEVIARIDKLQPTAERQWGKMDVAQMLAHCSVGLDLASGRLVLPRMLIGRLIGPFVRPIYSNDKPFSRNAPTDKKFVIADERDFGREREQLKTRVRQFHQGGEAQCTKHPHPFFGALTPHEWGTGMYKHLDHHLRQFGV